MSLISLNELLNDSKQREYGVLQQMRLLLR